MNKKPVIVAIIGKSGSGKTALTLYMNLVDNIPTICSYTTRKIRADETNGVQHYFVTEKDIPTLDKILAYTEFAGNYYWSTIDQVKGPIVTYVVDEKGFYVLKERHGNDFNIFCVYIDRDDIDVDEERQKRDDERIEIDDNDVDIWLNNDKDDCESFCEYASNIIMNELISRKLI